MKAIARLTLLHFTLFPTQQWLAVAAGVLLALAALVQYMGGPGVAPAVFAAILLILPMFMTLGAVFRTLTAPSTHRILPWFRLRMLAATALTLAFGAGLTAVLVHLLDGADGASIAATLVYSVAVFSVLIWVPVFAPLSIALIVPLLVAMLVPMLVGAARSAFGEINAALVLLAVLVCGWTLFARWFLRARRIGPHPIPALLRRREPRARTPRDAAEVSPAGAAAAYLLGGAPHPAKRALAGAIVLAWVGAMLALLGAMSGHGAHGTLAGPMLIAVTMPLTARAITRRARLLWLRDPASRAGLFRRIEAGVMLKELATALLVIVLFTVLAMRLTDLPASAAAALALAAAATAIAGCYLALMCVRAHRALEPLAVAVYAVTAGVTIVAVLTEPAHTSTLLAATGVQSASALVFRTMAARAWRSIDWLELRLPRALRRGGGEALRA